MRRRRKKGRMERDADEGSPCLDLIDGDDSAVMRLELGVDFMTPFLEGEILSRLPPSTSA